MRQQLVDERSVGQIGARPLVPNDAQEQGRTGEGDQAVNQYVGQLDVVPGYKVSIEVWTFGFIDFVYVVHFCKKSFFSAVS